MKRRTPDMHDWDLPAPPTAASLAAHAAQAAQRAHTLPLDHPLLAAQPAQQARAASGAVADVGGGQAGPYGFAYDGGSSAAHGHPHPYGTVPLPQLGGTVGGGPADAPSPHALHPFTDAGAVPPFQLRPASALLPAGNAAGGATAPGGTPGTMLGAHSTGGGPGSPSALPLARLALQRADSLGQPGSAGGGRLSRLSKAVRRDGALGGGPGSPRSALPPPPHAAQQSPPPPLAGWQSLGLNLGLPLSVASPGPGLNWDGGSDASNGSGSGVFPYSLQPSSSGFAAAAAVAAALQGTLPAGMFDAPPAPPQQQQRPHGRGLAFGELGGGGGGGGHRVLSPAFELSSTASGAAYAFDALTLAATPAASGGGGGGRLLPLRSSGGCEDGGDGLIDAPGGLGPGAMDTDDLVSAAAALAAVYACAAAEGGEAGGAGGGGGRAGGGFGGGASDRSSACTLDFSSQVGRS
jgi:hypothetical protein